jgi:hypothetical protein
MRACPGSCHPNPDPLIIAALPKGTLNIVNASFGDLAKNLIYLLLNNDIRGNK